jgi:hypothetical protein
MMKSAGRTFAKERVVGTDIFVDTSLAPPSLAKHLQSVADRYSLKLIMVQKSFEILCLWL